MPGNLGNSPNTWESGKFTKYLETGKFPKYKVIWEIPKILKIYQPQISGIPQMPGNLGNSSYTRESGKFSNYLVIWGIPKFLWESVDSFFFNYRKFLKCLYKPQTFNGILEFLGIPQMPGNLEISQIPGNLGNSPNACGNSPNF